MPKLWANLSYLLITFSIKIKNLGKGKIKFRKHKLMGQLEKVRKIEILNLKRNETLRVRVNFNISG